MFGDYKTCGAFPTSSPPVRRPQSILVQARATFFSVWGFCLITRDAGHPAHRPAEHAPEQVRALHVLRRGLLQDAGEHAVESGQRMCRADPHHSGVGVKTRGAEARQEDEHHDDVGPAHAARRSADLHGNARGVLAVPGQGPTRRGVHEARRSGIHGEPPVYADRKTCEPAHVGRVCDSVTVSRWRQKRTSRQHQDVSPWRMISPRGGWVGGC